MKLSIVSLVASAALCIGLATPTVAQSTGTRIGPRAAEPRDDSADEARRTLHDYGQCVVRSRQTRVEAVLALPANDPDYDRGIRALATGSCLSDSDMRMSPLLMRGSLFEGLVDIYYRDFRPATSEQIPTMDFEALHPGMRSGYVTNIIALNIFADCVLRAAPIPSRSLLDVAPTSNGEATLIAELSPHLGACLDTGQTFQLSRSVLRGALAEVIYLHTRNAGALSSAPGAP